MTDPRNDDPRHDRELEDYLAGRHALSVRYLEASRETAPPELDAAILASARAAAGRAPRRRARWRVPLAAAATMVLGVSLVSQLRDDAVPEAVRSDGDAPALRQKPAESVAPEGETVQTLSMEAVADRVAPSAPLPAPPPPPSQAKAAAPSAAQNEDDDRRRQEQTAGAALKRRETVELHKESAQAEMRSAAPQARAFALAPSPASAPSPTPSPAEMFDKVSIAARDLLQRLQSQDIDALTAHASAHLSAAQIEAAAPRFVDAHSAQIRPRPENDRIWHVSILDAQGRTLGDAGLVLVAQDWQLNALEPSP